MDRGHRAARNFLLLALLFPWSPRWLAASVATYMDTEDLARAARVIVRGEVESVVSEPDPGQSRIRTRVTIRVAESLKGAEGAGRVTIEQLGGAAGDRVQVVFGMPAFRPGERVVVFAAPTDDGGLTTAGLAQGKVRVQRIAGRPYAVREAPNGAVLLRRPGQRREPPLEPLPGFLEKVRDVVAGEPRPIRSHGAGPALAPDLMGVQERFTLLVSWLPLRWFEPDGGESVRLRFNAQDAPAVVPGGLARAFSAARAAWTNVAGAALVLEDGGSTTARCFQVDGTSAISHGNPCPQDRIPRFDATRCSGVLAIGGVSGYSGQQMTLNGKRFSRILEGDIVFNAGADCFWRQPGSYEEVLGHEIGHAIGLGHACGDGESPSCATSPELDDALMRAFAHGDGRGAALGADDVDAVRYLYPSGSFADPFLNQTAFRTGETMRLRVDANGTDAVDAYFALVLPNGSFLTVGEDGRLSALGSAVPYRTRYALHFLTDADIFHYTFTGSESAGDYAWVVVLVPPGADPLDPANWSAMDVEPFVFTP